MFDKNVKHNSLSMPLSPVVEKHTYPVSQTPQHEQGKTPSHAAFHRDSVVALLCGAERVRIVCGGDDALALSVSIIRGGVLDSGRWR